MFMRTVLFCFSIRHIIFVAAQGASNYEIGFGSFIKTHPKLNPKVVNGEDAKLGEFPHQVSLQLRGPLGSTHYCGGEVITASTVLTAGHCVTEVNIGGLQHVEVLSGLVDLKNPGSAVQSSKVARTIVNPDFPGGVAPNDLAIHVLASPFTLNKYVAAIALPKKRAIPEGEATLSGWGSTSHTQVPAMPSSLQKITLPIIPIVECLQAVDGMGTPLDETMVCTGPLTGGYGACSGDSGGPLIQGSGANATLVGVVSWGFIPCAQADVPSVYTLASAHLDFINDNTVY